MRRRERADPASAPAHLVRFDAADWPVTEPPPVFWRDNPEPYPWSSFAARRAWQRARQAWVAEQGEHAAAWTALDAR